MDCGAGRAGRYQSRSGVVEIVLTIAFKVLDGVHLLQRRWLRRRREDSVHILEAIRVHGLSGKFCASTTTNLADGSEITYAQLRARVARCSSHIGCGCMIRDKCMFKSAPVVARCLPFTGLG
jgi:hypothetical protein